MNPRHLKRIKEYGEIEKRMAAIDHSKPNNWSELFDQQQVIEKELSESGVDAHLEWQCMKTESPQEERVLRMAHHLNLDLDMAKYKNKPGYQIRKTVQGGARNIGVFGNNLHPKTLDECEKYLRMSFVADDPFLKKLDSILPPKKAKSRK